MEKNVWYCCLLTTQSPAMLKLCKLRSRDWERDPQQAKNYILALEIAFYIALSVVKDREHESEVKWYVMLDCCSTKNDSLKISTAQHQAISSSPLFTVTDESQNTLIFACFIVCHAVAPFRAAQDLCWCSSSFSSRQKFCICTSSVQTGFPVLVLLWLAMIQKALRLSPIHEPLVVKCLASLQTHVSTRLLVSLTALDVEANY